MNTYEPKVDPLILVCDGAHMLRRNMYINNLRELTNSTGMPTGAIYGFMNSLTAAVNSMNASSLVVCWEGGHSERRLSIYDQYKHRDVEENPEKDINGYTDYEYYKHQLSWIQKILECLGVHQISIGGKEGDDVLYQVSHMIDAKKVLISEDKDFYALVDENLSIYRPIKKQYIDINTFEEVSGGYKTPQHFLYGKVLLGDGSDNIPSVCKGVGESTVLKILDRVEDPSELSPTRILKEALSIGNARCMRLYDQGSAPIERNLDLIDISREPFDVFQLKNIQDNLETEKSTDVISLGKLYHVLEFSEKTTRFITSRLLEMSHFPLSKYIDKNYIKSVLIGGMI